MFDTMRLILVFVLGVLLAGFWSFFFGVATGKCVMLLIQMLNELSQKYGHV